jgi:hypothetical protein
MQFELTVSDGCDPPLVFAQSSHDTPRELAVATIAARGKYGSAHYDWGTVREAGLGGEMLPADAALTKAHLEALEGRGPVEEALPRWRQLYGEEPGVFSQIFCPLAR